MNIVIIGAGQAAATLAFKLRELDFTGEITIFGNESVYPYQRPPLSKKYLSGAVAQEDLFIRDAAAYAENNIHIQLNNPVQHIDLAEQYVKTRNGQTFFWDRLVFATGATPRGLPNAEIMQQENVFTFRQLADCHNLRPYMHPQRHLCIVGGGYIGLELAAVAREHGMQVTVLERETRILQRVACQQTAQFVTRFHQSMQTEILTQQEIDTFTVQHNRVQQLHLKSGKTLDIDVMVVGIGVIPETDLARQVNLTLDGGAIAVNDYCQTSDSRVYAIGDCSCFNWGGKNIRLESVQNALEQAEVVAQHILGNLRAYHPSPWFWSDQGRLKIQIAGLALDYDSVISRVDCPATKASFWYFCGETLVAVDALNDARAFMSGRKFIGTALANKERLADVTSELKTILSPAAICSNLIV